MGKGGQTLTEYTLILALIVLVAFFALNNILGKEVTKAGFVITGKMAVAQASH
jgi:hypothetical protein